MHVSVEQNFLRTTLMFKRTETQSDLIFTWIRDIYGFQRCLDDNRTMICISSQQKPSASGWKLSQQCLYTASVLYMITIYSVNIYST